MISFFYSTFDSPSSALLICVAFETTGFRGFYSVLFINAQSYTETFKTPWAPDEGGKFVTFTFLRRRSFPF